MKPSPGFAVLGLHTAYAVTDWLSVFANIVNATDARYATFGVLGDPIGVGAPGATGPGSAVPVYYRFESPTVPLSVFAGLRFSELISVSINQSTPTEAEVCQRLLTKGRQPTSLLEPARALTAAALNRLRYLMDHARTSVSNLTLLRKFSIADGASRRRHWRSTRRTRPTGDE